MAPLVVWVSVAILLTLTTHLFALRRQFEYDGSADFAVMARAFAQHGVIALRAVPIRNNPPLGLERDAYTHWPPLFPIVLAMAFRFFGESEAVANGLMLLLLLANSAALYALLASCCGHQAGLMAVFALMVIPATAAYAGEVLLVPLAILGLLLALLGFIKATRETAIHRRWAALGAGAFLVAVLTSWEPLLAGAGLVAASLWIRRRPQILLSLIYCAVGLLGASGVLAIYLVNYPSLASDLWYTVLFRLRFLPYKPDPASVHLIFHEYEYGKAVAPSLVDLGRRLASRIEMIGQLPALALGWLLAEGWLKRHRPGDGALVVLFAGLLAPWVLWATIMSNHTFIHEYTMMYAVPAAAAGLALAASRVVDFAARTQDLSRRRALYAVVFLVLPVVMLLPLSKEGVYSWVLGARREPWAVAYGRVIREATEPGAVVMSNLTLTVPVYYSHRHVIRGVSNDAAMQRILGRLAAAFPGAPLYLALHPNGPQDFRQSLERYRVIRRAPNLVLLAVTEADRHADTETVGRASSP